MNFISVKAKTVFKKDLRLLIYLIGKASYIDLMVVLIAMIV